MDVCVLGSINLDIVQRVERLPRPGETVLSRSTARLLGGKGANQAIAAARMACDFWLRWAQMRRVTNFWRDWPPKGTYPKVRRSAQ